MFVDKVTIRVIAGKGGNGCCSFRRETLRPLLRLLRGGFLRPGRAACDQQQRRKKDRQPFHHVMLLSRI